jgi:tetratricopeptide (TPR) repeat protein
MRRAILTLLALLLTTTVAAAQNKPKPSKQDIAEAKKHFKAAEEAKRKGEWDKAADEYLAAYARFPDPEFYFNVGEVYRNKGDDEKALQYYVKYLEMDANGRGSSAARTAVAEINRALEARKAAEEEARKKAYEDARKKAEEEQRRKAEEEARRQPPGDDDDDDDDDVVMTTGRPGRGLRIGGIVSGGIGVAALGAGVFFGLRARSISNEAADWDVFDPDRFAQGEAAERNMIICVGIGGAALVTGGVLYFMGHRAGARAERRMSVAPVLLPDGAGLAAGGSF